MVSKKVTWCKAELIHQDRCRCKKQSSSLDYHHYQHCQTWSITGMGLNEWWSPWGRNSQWWSVNVVLSSTQMCNLSLITVLQWKEFNAICSIYFWYLVQFYLTTGYYILESIQLNTMILASFTEHYMFNLSVKNIWVCFCVCISDMCPEGLFTADGLKTSLLLFLLHTEYIVNADSMNLYRFILETILYKNVVSAMWSSFRKVNLYKQGWFILN